MLGNLFILTLFLPWIKCFNIKDIISKFDENGCIEDNFIEPDVYLHISNSMKSMLIKENEHNANSPGDKGSLSMIHELAQHNDVDYYYYLEKEEGPSHEKVFYVLLKLGSEIYKGKGKSLKNAKRHAAEEALIHTNYIIPQSKEKEEDKILTPTVELNNIAMKLGMKVTYLSEDELIAESFMYKQKNITIPDGKSFKTYNDRLNHSIYHPYTSHKLDVPKETSKGRPFKVGVVVGEMRFIGIGYTLQSARHDAAIKALTALRQLSQEDIDQCLSDGVVCNPNNVKSPISLLYEMAQKQKIPIDFEVIKENGPAHEKEFVTRCQFGDLSIEGVGKSKKASKRSASENMLEKLKYSTPSNTDMGFSTSSNSKKKKNKNKIIKNSLEKFSKDAKDFMTSTWEYVFPDEKTETDDDNVNKKKKKPKQKDDNSEETSNFKGMLLEMTQEKGIPIHFLDLGIQKSKHYSLLFVGIKPNHVCLGDGRSYELSRQKASIEALNFFHKLGIESLIPCQETFKYIQNMDFGKMYMVDSNVILNNEENKQE